MNCVAVEGDYLAQGKADLFQNARRAMQDPEFMKTATECKMSEGMWATDKVLLLVQVAQSLDDAAQPSNKQVLKEELDTIPWLATAASEARRKYAMTFKTTVEKSKAAVAAQPCGVEARRAKLRKITQAAAAKLKAETAEKEAKALEKQQLLVKESTMEHLRLEYGGKKQKATPTALQEKLGKACRCLLAITRTSALSNRRTCVQLCA